AEFNIAADPEAAAIVFGAGWRVTMTGLDVTLRARANGAIRQRLAALGRLGRDLLLPSLSGYQADEATGAKLGQGGEPGHGGGPGQGGGAGRGGEPGHGGGGPDGHPEPGGEGPAVHDVCALALVAEPGLFGCWPARVEVETAGRWTAGMTVTDFRAPAHDNNA